jgi:predicted dehydrogenase
VAVKAMAERGIVGSDFVFPTLGDRPLVAKAMAERGSSDNKCEMYRDFRDLLDRDDIDAVLIATSDRWHAHAAMMAAEAGKDVYVEKPCAMTIELTQRLADTFHRASGRYLPSHGPRVPSRNAKTQHLEFHPCD